MNKNSLVYEHNRFKVSSYIGIFSKLPQKIELQRASNQILFKQYTPKLRKPLQDTVDITNIGKIKIKVKYSTSRHNQEVKFIEESLFGDEVAYIIKTQRKRLIVDIIRSFIKQKQNCVKFPIKLEKFRLIKYQGTLIFNCQDNQKEVDLILVNLKKYYEQLFQDKGRTFRQIMFLKYQKHISDIYVLYQDQDTYTNKFCKSILITIDMVKYFK
ncbi:hypothetical protein SS50377_20880 [Spironucleus salmonicida]|uniref:Uncharacterized protein n=1 Tax=Spironucleus salmonicida TaxID=348837 RepID=V6LIL5_9EUKA|nr:hypothetical protein SS50377_20880 [Spironucleus salmonicida]|eukprot:EST43556.1 Hypothetical protein SS50377_16594 [Spironucleus salmonicida]